ncbi:MAG: hypothetical protein WCP71_05840 [Actinomycetes bacterium]
MRADSRSGMWRSSGAASTVAPECGAAVAQQWRSADSHSGV